MLDTGGLDCRLGLIDAGFDLQYRLDSACASPQLMQQSVAGRHGTASYSIINHPFHGYQDA